MTDEELSRLRRELREMFVRELNEDEAKQWINDLEDILTFYRLYVRKEEK